jgi:hypothetical protein
MLTLDSKIQIPYQVIPHGISASISFWNYSLGTAAGSSSVISSHSPLGGYVCNAHLPWTSLNIYFDHGIDRVTKACTSEEILGWHHWVLAKDGLSGIMRIYRDGLIWAEGTDKKSNPMVPIDPCYIGNGGHVANISDVRLYSHALTVEEIKDIFYSR